MKTLFLLLIVMQAMMACEKSNVIPTVSTENRVGTGLSSFSNDFLPQVKELSGNALYVYLDVYYTDPNKIYVDVDSSNYEQIINESFAYANDLTITKPYYCSSGNFQGKGNYVYIRTVCDGNLSVDDFIAVAKTIAPQYTYIAMHEKFMTEGVQQNFKRLQ